MAEASAEVSDDGGQGFAGDGGSGDEDEDEALPKVVLLETKSLPQETAGAASLDGAADSPARHHTEGGGFASGLLQPVGNEAAAGPPFSARPDAMKSARAMEAPTGRQAEAGRRGHKFREARLRRRSTAGALFAAGGGSRCARSWWTCGRGSPTAACGGFWKVGTGVS